MATGGKFTVPSGSALTVRQLQYILADYPKTMLDNPVFVMGAYGKIQPAGSIDTSPDKGTSDLTHVTIGAHQKRKDPHWRPPAAA
jgi:hypothetical protein